MSSLIRGVPLISVLFMASFMFPLLLPIGKSPDVLVRVVVGITLFAAPTWPRWFAAACSLSPHPDRGGGQPGPGMVANTAQDRPAASTRSRGAQHHEQLHLAVQGHLAGHHRVAVRTDRRARPGTSAPTRTGGPSRSRPTFSSPGSTSPSALRCRATACRIERRLASGQSPLNMNDMSALHPLRAVNKWYGNGLHVLRDIDLAVKQGERLVVCGPFGLGQVDADPLHQRARGLPGRHRSPSPGSWLGDDPKVLPRCGARSAWCSSSSTCFPI
jgi:hypothetical protein